MRRFISIFLSLIILVVGAHPVLAMHFCAGDLFSVNLTKANQQNHFCCEKMENMPTEDCGSKSHSHHKPHSAFTEEHDNCCTFKQVKLSTDDFNHQIQQSSLNNILPSFFNVWFVLYSAVNYLESDSSVIVQHIFPPGGLDKLNIDLLAYICTYRI
ncbi:hypothetical protein [Dysgonomonas termitidis]|uniref:Secreted protein n=1 Tax=Dysgonomonas termitidis TaxID=1516126 RepID=A0ABV9KYC4_9BACT